MKFFMPDWDDRIDPGFDFVADTFTTDRDIATNDVYAHEVFSSPPYDGLLVSRAVVERRKTRNEKINRDGIHSVFRVSKDFPILGDCGAFSYLKEKHPRYETGDVLEYYSRIGVNYGVSVDHLVLDKMEPAERLRRKAITLINARSFLEGHQSQNCQFIPIGVAQGWSPESYADSVWKLLEIGYDYVALGGLARSSAKYILSVLQEVNIAINDFKVLHDMEKVNLHLFGVAKAKHASRFQRLGVTSIDSASHLRKAWLRSGQNYWTESGEWYTAVRVPQTTNSRVRKYVSKNGRNMPEVIRKEERVLRLLRAHDKGRLDDRLLNKLLDEILYYDDYLLRAGDDGKEMRNKTLSREKYYRVLADKPWEDCRCDICQDVGIQVVIFRGTNRNKRRGFHNVWVFYQRLQKQLTGLA